MKREILNKGNDIVSSIREHKIAVASLERQLKEHPHKTYHKFSDITLCTDEIEMLLKMKEIHIFNLEKELEKL